MKTISRFTLAIITINSLQTLNAHQVNHQTGALTIAEQDDVEDFVIRREYSSRSIFHGWFGIGWCSNFDYSLTQEEDKSITINLCDKPLLRFEKSSSTIFRVPYRVNQIIVSIGDSFYWTAGDGYTYVFNSLKALYGVKKGNQWIAKLDDSKPLGSLKISRHADLQLIQSINGKSTQISFLYSNTQLRSVSINAKNKANYTYDDADNLTLLSEVDKQTLFDYDSNLDRITKIIKSDGTTEYFNYIQKSLPKNQNESHLLSVTHTVLRGKEILSSFVSQYYYQNSEAGDLKLVRANLPSRSLSESTEVQYSKSGLPSFIRQKGKAFKVLFSPDRKVSELRWNNESYLFLYNHPEGKLTSIIERNLSPSNSNQIVSRADFNYDRSGRLINTNESKVYHPYDLQNLESDYAFKQVVPFEPVRALAAIRGG